jgi:hypothetical protein
MLAQQRTEKSAPAPVQAYDTLLLALLQRVTLSDWQNSLCCSKIAEAEAVVSVNEKKWLVMHVHVQMRLDELGRIHFGSLWRSVKCK